MLTAAQVKAEKILVVPGFLEKGEAKQYRACAGSYEKSAAYMEQNESIRHMAEGLSRMTALGRKNGVAVTF